MYLIRLREYGLALLVLVVERLAPHQFNVVGISLKHSVQVLKCDECNPTK